MKKSEFQHILTLARSGKSAVLSFEADGVTYTRNFRPQERLILLGGGHIGQALCHFAAELDFSVVVVDDRSVFANRARFPKAQDVLCADFPIAIQRLGITENDYVAVITRGHRCDADCLRTILAGVMPKYLGMIGSRRRVIGLLHLLAEEGFPQERLDQITAPIGVEIGALTVREIAISILAQLIQHRREGTNRRSRSAFLTTENIDFPLLEFLAEAESPRCVLLVYETSGSTPVKAGAMMALDQEYRTAGTIGGGCSENAILEDAYYLIGTGGHRCFTVDMSNAVAAEEGMVCGGQMKVLVEDVTN